MVRTAAGLGSIPGWGTRSHSHVVPPEKRSEKNQQVTDWGIQVLHSSTTSKGRSPMLTVREGREEKGGSVFTAPRRGNGTRAQGKTVGGSVARAAYPIVTGPSVL